MSRFPPLIIPKNGECSMGNLAERANAEGK